MGQPVHLQLFAESDAAGYEAAQSALAELRRVEHALSLFDDTSDLVELNRRAGRGPLAVGPDLLAVLGAAVRLGQDTGGAFDVAVEPLMRAWGFHAARTTPPTESELRAARAAVRAARIALEPGAPPCRRSRPGSTWAGSASGTVSTGPARCCAGPASAARCST